jgi:hypothetical protein
MGYRIKYIEIYKIFPTIRLVYIGILPKVSI